MLRLRQIAGAARWTVLLIGASWLAACGQGAAVQSTQTTSGTPPGSSTPSSITLKMTGTPAPSVVVGNLYAFQPTVTESSGTVAFSVTGAPAWATFNNVTGELTGTPSSADVGTSGPITIIANDGGTSATLGPFTITVDAPTVTLTMTGTPAASVVAGNLYTFQPTVSASSGTATFSITGLPAWATFNSATGELSGTPSSADVGTSGPITIVANDGGSSASLGPFTIAVDAAITATGSATLSWVAPTRNTDGSALTDLAGYLIYYGTSANALTQTITVSATSTTYVLNQLTAGTYYFAVAAYTSAGTQSALSSVASKTI